MVMVHHDLRRIQDRVVRAQDTVYVIRILSSPDVGACTEGGIEEPDSAEQRLPNNHVVTEPHGKRLGRVNKQLSRFLILNSQAELIVPEGLRPTTNHVYSFHPVEFLPDCRKPRLTDDD